MIDLVRLSTTATKVGRHVEACACLKNHSGFDWRASNTDLIGGAKNAARYLAWTEDGFYALSRLRRLEALESLRRAYSLGSIGNDLKADLWSVLNKTLPSAARSVQTVDRSQNDQTQAEAECRV